MKLIVRRIFEEAALLGSVKLMEVCGGHTNTIMRYGIQNIMPDNVKLVSGPGCPVCVTDQSEIDAVVGLALLGVPVATYGDMLRVPGLQMSLEKARANGANVRAVFCANEVLSLPKEFVFFGIGFETTAPMTASLLRAGRVVYSAHKLIPPAMAALLSGELKIDGFICPGHVSTVIGEKPYHLLKVPQVISGFGPEQVLHAILILLQQLNQGRCEAVNDYKEAVRYDGNAAAQEIMREQFRIVDSSWRGLGVIPMSGLEPMDDRLNAKLVYSKMLSSIPVNTKGSGCMCGSVLKGLIEPRQCPLFMKACTQSTPVGACAVTPEGACNIAMRYGGF